MLMVLVTKIAHILRRVELVNGYNKNIDEGYIYLQCLFITNYLFID